MSRLAFLALLTLSACVPQSGRGPATPSAKDRADCTAAGGQIVPGGLDPWVCEVPLPDGGQSCRAAEDCTGVCMAPGEGTGPGLCAATAPTLGCNEVYIDRDAPSAMFCVD